MQYIGNVLIWVEYQIGRYDCRNMKNSWSNLRKMKGLNSILCFMLLLTACSKGKQNNCNDCFEYAVDYLAKLPEINIQIKDSMSFILHSNEVNEQNKEYLIIKFGYNNSYRFETLYNYYLFCEDTSIFFLNTGNDSLIKVR